MYKYMILSRQNGFEECGTFDNYNKIRSYAFSKLCNTWSGKTCYVVDGVHIFTNQDFSDYELKEYIEQHFVTH